MIGTLKACHRTFLSVGGAGTSGLVPIFRAHLRRSAGLEFSRCIYVSFVAVVCLKFSESLEGSMWMWL